MARPRGSAAATRDGPDTDLSVLADFCGSAKTEDFWEATSGLLASSLIPVVHFTSGDGPLVNIVILSCGPRLVSPCRFHCTMTGQPQRVVNRYSAVLPRTRAPEPSFLGSRRPS